MTQRLIAIVLVLLFLILLISYSQFRPPVDRVSGFVEADEIRLGSRVGGRVRAVYVEEGESVVQGQVLVELEPFDLLEREREALSKLMVLDAAYRRLVGGLRPAEVAQAKAQHDQFKARLDLLKAGPREQEIDIARGRLRVAEVELKLAERNYQRRTDLSQSNVIAREELDEASEQLEAAQAWVAVRQEELELLELGARDEEKREAAARVEEAWQAWQLAESGYQAEVIEEAKAARDAAEAALAAIREQQNELAIKSPIAGVVEALDLQKGDLVPAGAPVLSVVYESELWVRAYVPQNRFRLRVGQELSVTVDSFGDERFRGELTFISRQAEFTPSNVQTPEERSKQVFRVKVKLKEGLKRLRPGMTADVWLDGLGETP